MSERRLSRTLKDLFLACLNATLILVALCLFLAWQVFDTLQGVTDDVLARAIELAPLREDVQALTQEGAAVREELQALRTAAQSGAEVASPVIAARITSLESKVTATTERLDALIEAPEDLLVNAIDLTAERATQSVSELLNCRRTDT